jgi:CubicO group peptidase (beta-lactamase class C family)
LTNVTLAGVETLFRQQQARGAFPGGQLVVQHGDQRLLDVAVGTASGWRRAGAAQTKVTETTQFQVMSASKAVLAVAVARLEERRLIDVRAPVRRYIPEFVAAEVTILDVLTHRSGVTLPELSRHPERWSDPDNVLAALREEAPTYRRGTLAYQPMAFGWILGEVVRRVAGESLEAFSARELGGELHWRFGGEAAETYWLGAARYMLNGANLAAGFEETNNHISGRTALVPGAGMYTTARALASFYARLGRDDSPVLRRYTRAQTRGRDRITGAYVVLGCGFAIGWRWPHPFGWWNSQESFGHAGGFSVVAYADRKTGAAVAIVTNGNRSMWDLVRRFAPIGTAIRKALSGDGARMIRPG